MNPILFDLGLVKIEWYSFLIILGISIAAWMIFVEGKRFNIQYDFLFNMMFWTIIFGIFGARLYYVIFNWNYYASHVGEIIKIWNGGLAIHGALIAGVLTIFLYCKKYNVNYFRILDIVLVPTLIAQAIGRWGNFFNSEAHGAATSLAALKKLPIPNFVIEGMKIGQTYYQPTFYYESLWCLIGFFVLLMIRKYRYLKVSQLTCLYMIWYGIGRFFIEAARTDSLMLGGFKMAQIVSILFVLSGIILFIILQQKGKFESLYNETNTNKKVGF